MPVYGIRNRDVVYRATFAIAMSLLVAACSSSRPAVPPIETPSAPSPPPQVGGIASWDGPGFDGRRTPAGAIYHQEDLTAASNDFPLGSRVMVTNLENGRSIEVALIDRGTFKEGRKIVLSH